MVTGNNQGPRAPQNTPEARRLQHAKITAASLVFQPCVLDFGKDISAAKTERAVDRPGDC